MGELAHIIPANLRGPRGQSERELTETGRAMRENIIMLCPTCHTLIDKAPEKYPADLLRNWKRRSQLARAIAHGTPEFASSISATYLCDLLYVSEDKIYRRLTKTPHINTGENPLASRDLVMQAIIEIEAQRYPRPYTALGLESYEWITFDLEMKFRTAYGDSELPPEDVALFASSNAYLHRDVPRKTNLLLCGSQKHLRTHSIEGGRMGSDTHWLHVLILEIQRRYEDGIDFIPEFITEVLQGKVSQSSIELSALHTFQSWCEKPGRGRLRGHATVLMDIDRADFPFRLVVASPLYVEKAPPVVRAR
ncbi:SAVMC3_10250 family protein [Spirillospora sp. CA-108201]